MEHFIVTQTKTNEALGESVSQLTSKFKTITSYEKNCTAGEQFIQAPGASTRST